MVRLVVALILLFPAVVWAGKEEGVMAEFRKVEEDIKNKEISPAVRKKTLEANLVRAMKLAIERRFYWERQQYLADLTPESISYENSDHVTYYVRFKDFIARFDFARNPELLIQAPVYEKFLIKDDPSVHPDN